MLGITDYLWRLIPANPILLRVVSTAGKRRRDLIIRAVYLGLLVLVVIFSILTTSGEGVGAMDLAALAKTSSILFQQMSYLQLGLVALLAPIFTAGAITQEKDSQTYDILLSTPLTNGQIVLGSLLSRLFFVLALLISGIPIFSITQIFGGVAVSSISLSFLIAAATAFVTGALAMAIATFKVGTRRTIFSFYLFIAIYLMGVYMLDRIDFFHPVVDAKTGELAKTSWLTGIHPFLALRVIFNDPEYLPPDLGSLPESLQGWPVGWYLSSPVTFYISLMFFLSLVLVLPSIGFLRRVAQSSMGFRTWILTKIRLSKGDKTRKPRTVWSNPIAWREAKTKASAFRASILRYAFITAGVLGALVLAVRYGQSDTPQTYISPGSYDAVRHMVIVIDGDTPRQLSLSPTVNVLMVEKKPDSGETVKREISPEALRQKLEVAFMETTRAGGNVIKSLEVRQPQRKLSEENARQYLLYAAMTEFAVILLIVTNAAASTVTREKEDGTLDLLLSTPITSRYYIWGKLRGLVSFVLPLIAVPVISAGIFIFFDIVRLMASSSAEASTFKWIVFPEALIILPGTLIIISAFAAILGMQMSLRCRKTVVAVMSSVGIVAGICAALGFCGFNFITHSGRSGEVPAMVLSTGSPFTVLALLIDPYSLAVSTFTSNEPGDVVWARVLVLLFSWAATALYGVIVWTMYKSMVKNFDMTIRKQSR